MWQIAFSSKFTNIFRYCTWSSPGMRLAYRIEITAPSSLSLWPVYCKNKLAIFKSSANSIVMQLASQRARQVMQTSVGHSLRLTVKWSGCSLLALGHHRSKHWVLLPESYNVNYVASVIRTHPRPQRIGVWHTFDQIHFSPSTQKNIPYFRELKEKFVCWYQEARGRFK